MSHALIVGAHGQDGQLLSRLLTAESAKVTPIGRGDLDLNNLEALKQILQNEVTEIYYLAAYHHSSQEIIETDESSLYQKSTEVHVTGLANFLETMRLHYPRTRLFYASSSLVFGNSRQKLLDELTPFAPQCIYSITKTAGLQICRYYREKYGLFAATGILFNHESHLRNQKFVIPKIIDAALSIAKGSNTKLILGDITARVDWGYAPDYVEAMKRIVHLQEGDDFIIATGRTYSIQDALEVVFGLLKLDWNQYVEVRPDTVHRKRTTLCGNPSKLQKATGWIPSMGFEEMLSTILKNRPNA